MTMPMPDSMAPRRRIAPRPFALAAVAVYTLGFLSQGLLSPDWLARGGLWAFAAVQIVLMTAWYVLHARRLRDAGRSAGPAIGIAALCGLSILLLLLVVGFLQEMTQPQGTVDPVAAWFGFAIVFGMLFAASDMGGAGAVLILLALCALLPLIVAVCFTVWAGTRRRERSIPE